MADMSLHDAAVAYARRGWAVFALKPRSKEPATTHGVKDATTDAEAVDEWWTEHPRCNIGIAMGSASGGLVAIDVDVDEAAGKDGMATLRSWERDHGELPETASTITGRGGSHILYRMDGARNSVNQDAGVDVRGEGGYIVAPPSVHPNGGRYEWEYDPEDYGVAEADENVRAFVTHVNPKAMFVGRFAKTVDLNKTVVKGGRNNALFRALCSMQSRNCGDDEIEVFADTYNRMKLEPPLPDWEVRKVLESVLSLPKGNPEAMQARNAERRKAEREGCEPVEDTVKTSSQFKHNECAKLLMDEHGACFVDGMPAVRDGDRYRVGWNAIDAVIISMRDDVTMQKQREVHHYLTVKAPRIQQSRASLIGFVNGVLDVDTMDFRGYDASDVIPNVIPHRWNPDAADPGGVVMRTLEKMACGDVGMEANLTEAIGLCMYRNSRHFPYCPVLLGTGSNGKSTYISMLRSVIGDENMSAMQPREIGMRFQAGQLLGKLANLGDDISSDYIDGDGCAVIKKVATGDVLYTDVKGGEGFTFTPYATMVFSANRFPRLGDSSDGMMRRLFPMQFNARFSRDDPDYDPRISDKLADEAAVEYMVKLGVEGLRRIIAQGGMTPNEASERIVGDIRTDNNTVLQWMDDESVGAEQFVGQPKSAMYEPYKDWCMDNGCQYVSSRTFAATVRDATGLTLCRFDHPYVNGVRKTVKVFDYEGAAPR